ncbi:MAG: phage portal protein, partial [Bauldia sp.]
MKVSSTKPQVQASLPWVKRFEDEADFKLFGQNRRGLYTKMNLLGLLRGDFKSQADGFKVYREMGVVNADEIRERLDMNKMEPGLGGEKYTMNGSYMTLEQIGEEPAAPAALPAPTPAPEPDDDAQMAMRE